MAQNINQSINIKAKQMCSKITIIFIIKCFRTIIFIFIAISTTLDTWHNGYRRWFPKLLQR